MTSEEQISIGFFPDFLDPTVLFWGSLEALDQLAAFLRGMARQGKGRIFLNEQNWINPRRGTRIWLEVSQPASGMTKVPGTAKADFTWRINVSQALKFADLIESLSKSQKPGHHYLDSEVKDEVVVVVSRGEYDGLDIAAD